MERQNKTEEREHREAKMPQEGASEGQEEFDAETDTKDSGQNVFDITGKFKQEKPQPPERKSRLVGVTDKKVETKRILIFLALCFGMTWLMELAGVIPMYLSEDPDTVKEAMNMITQVMLAPALSAMAARLFTREGLVKSGFQFNFSEHKFLFLFGWFGMTVLTFAGAVLYFLIFRDNFDPNMTNFVASYGEKAASAGTEASLDSVQIVAAFKADLLIKVFTVPVLDIVSSFGEEWGFRAYLLPKLFRKIGPIPAMLVSGLASGLWYAPLVSLGFYYGSDNAGFPVPNILAMCVFGMVTGGIYAFLCLRTGSIFPSVFAHSAVNVMMSQAALMTFDGGNFFVGPAPTGILSGLPFLVTALVCLVYMYKHPIQVNSESQS